MQLKLEQKQKKKTAKMMTTTEMRTLRSIAGVTLHDRQMNDEIGEKCGVQDVTKWIKTRRKGWRDHVLRMTEDRLPKIAMKGKLDTPRPLG